MEQSTYMSDRFVTDDAEPRSTGLDFVVHGLAFSAVPAKITVGDNVTTKRYVGGMRSKQRRFPMKLKECWLGVSVGGVMGTLLLFLPSLGFAQAPFYEGKTITIIGGREAGGTGDNRVSAVIPFLKKYIPGQPHIVSAFMPGAGGRKAANHDLHGSQS